MNQHLKLRPRQTVSNQQPQELVYFRVRRPVNEVKPEQQLIVDRNPSKKYYTNKGELRQKEITEEEMKTKIDEITNIFSQVNLQNSVQYFLKRVDSADIGALSQADSIGKQSFLQKANNLSKQMRKDFRQTMIAQSRGLCLKSESVNIKILDLENELEEVEFNNQKIKVQNMGNVNTYYYTLSKRTEIKEGPTVAIPHDAHYLLDRVQFEQQASDEDEPYAEDEQDSNRESNPDYDYPDQGYSDSGDEGVIRGDYYPGNSDEESSHSDAQIDEQEHYRRYLRRCKKDKNKEESDDEYFL